jgi:hypothetical protein
VKSIRLLGFSVEVSDFYLNPRRIGLRSNLRVFNYTLEMTQH